MQDVCVCAMCMEKPNISFDAQFHFFLFSENKKRLHCTGKRGSNKMCIAHCITHSIPIHVRFERVRKHIQRCIRINAFGKLVQSIEKTCTFYSLRFDLFVEVFVAMHKTIHCRLNFPMNGLYPIFVLFSNRKTTTAIDQLCTHSQDVH